MKIKGDRICSLCGTYYKEERGHKLNDCWGILHQQLLEADANAQDLRYKLEKAQKRINEAKLDKS